MKILFIYPSDNNTFNAGIGYLSAVLKLDGHKTGLYLTSRFNEQELGDRLRAFQPDLVAVSSVTNQFRLARQLILQVKRKVGVPVLLGGVHATINPEEAIRVEGVDAVCIGEGEETFREYVSCHEADKSVTDIEGLWVNDGEHIHRNPIRQPIQDLSQLPFPDYDLFDYDTILREMGVFMVFANRGCPYECSYCVNHALKALYKPGHYIRFMPVRHLLDNLKDALTRYPEARIVEFFDDTFILNKKWFQEFVAGYSLEIGLPFYCNGRADLIDREMIDLLRQAGCVRVNLAIETGNEELRQRVLQKNVSNAALERAFTLLHRAGIRTYAHNMVGIPGETEESIRETIALNRHLKVDDLQCWVFFPYPGSSSFELCREKGWISNRQSDTVAGTIVTSPLDQPTITYERVSLYHRIFKYLVLESRTPVSEVPLDYMYLGHIESQMISGWNNLEQDRNIFFRWTTAEGRFYLKNSGKKYLRILANFPAPCPPVLVEVIINDTHVGDFIPIKGQWQWYTFFLPAFSEKILEVTLTIDNPYLPCYHDVNDKRVLGVALSKISLKTSWELFSERVLTQFFWRSGPK
ncbi:B12-binding domain-containing radical SAM protein [bacterium]|nr:B12-binding domain-containing radical SAM protein [bacterium]